MKRDALAEILNSTDGISTQAQAYEVDEEHRLDLYLGRPGQAMVIGDVGRLELSDAFLRLVAREGDATMFINYDDIAAVALRPPKETDRRRTGFA